MGQIPDSRPLRGVHHGAFRCRDVEQTLWFYRDVLGITDYTGVVIEAVPGSGADDPYLHLFFRMGNGEYLAFFDAPGSADPDWFQRKESFDMHWAFEVAGEADLLAMQERIRAMGVSAVGPIDHGFVRSIYMYDPNGIQIELTYRTAGHDAILAEETAKIDQTIADWTRRTRAQKEAKFGAAAIDRRSRNPA